MLNPNNIFVINLPERVHDRLEPLSQQLKIAGYDDFNVWVATRDVDGRKGLLYSMYYCLEHCISKELPGVLILEDDAQFVHYSHYIQTCIDQLPLSADLLYLGGYLIKPVRKLYSENLIKLDKSMYSTHAIYYTQEGMRKVYEILKQILFRDSKVLPYDSLLLNRVQSQGECYCTYPMIMKQRAGYSDIEKQEVDYTKYHDQQFIKMTAGLPEIG